MVNDKDSIAWREVIKEVTEKLSGVENNLQNIHTPFELVYNIIGKLKEYTELNNKEFCVFNLEFIEVLCYDFGVPLERIWFMTDCKEKEAIAKSSRYNGVNVMKEDFFEMLKKKNEGKQFDVVLGNPPYQDPKNKRLPLWQKFVTKSLFLCKDNGYISLIHPSNWRKPDHELFNSLKQKQMKYLEMHSASDGQRVFGCGTCYDWYILQNKKCEDNTLIKDYDGEFVNRNLQDTPFLSHRNFDLLTTVLAKNNEEKCEVLYSRSAYASDKANMSKEKKGEFKHPCVHATSKNGTKYWYSKTENNGHFGIKKIILGLASWDNPFYDDKGEFGITQNCFGITIENENDFLSYKKALENPEFVKLLKSMIWSGFAIDFRAFKYFKKKFWKKFV